MMDSHPTKERSSFHGDPHGPSASSYPKQEPSKPRPRAPNGRKYGPRSCRICLETEYPKFPAETTTTFGIASTSPHPTYISDDPELGRLLSPCKCKGSQKYVHEGCLQAWRLANPHAERNYWQCPTCKFTYRMTRLHWAAALSSKRTQVALTILILFLSVFILGFVADPLFDLWYDPLGTLTDTFVGVVKDIEALKPLPYEPPSTWTEHFTKGFFSLGLVGFFKSMLAMTPWQWLNIRHSGALGGSGRRQVTGRDRMANISLVFVLIGATTFLMGIWKFVKALSARVLQNVSDRVLDINDDDHGDSDDDIDDENPPQNKGDE